MVPVQDGDAGEKMSRPLEWPEMPWLTPDIGYIGEWRGILFVDEVVVGNRRQRRRRDKAESEVDDVTIP